MKGLKMANKGASRFADYSATQLLELEAKTEANLIGAQRQLADLQADLRDIRELLAQRMRPASAPRVSDHALLRFIERVMGLDVEALRARILNEKTVPAINAGATAITVDNVRFVVKDKTVVTIIDKRRD